MMSLSKTNSWTGALFVALGLLACLGAAPIVFAQQPPAQQPPLAKPDQVATTPLSDVHKPADPQEDVSYKAFLAVKPDDAAQIIQLGEDFLKKYPTSAYAPTVYARLTQAYFNKNQIDKMLVAGEKAIALNPSDVESLTTVGWVIPHAYNPNDLDADQKLGRAEVYLKHAIEVVGALVKPATMTDEQFALAKNEALSRSHSGLGLVNFRRGKFADSMSELEQATKLIPNPDPVDLYVMGIDLQNLKRFTEAVTTFEKCAQVPSGVQDRCKQSAEQSKRLAATGAAPAKP